MFQYYNMSNLNPLKPIAIWTNTNTILDKKYKSSDINLSDKPEDLEIKNTARHITGLGLVTSQYWLFAFKQNLSGLITNTLIN